MSAYGAELILVTEEEGMEGARDLAIEMNRRGEGKPAGSIRESR